MRKIALVAGLAAAAALMALVGSASATVTAGAGCTLKGTAAFSPGISPVLRETHYTFKSTTASCPTTPASEKQETEVEGNSELSCLVSFGGGGEFPERGKAGTGQVRYTSGGKAEKDVITSFKFSGRGAEVKFSTEGTVKATGTAEFKAEEGAPECAKGLAGSNQLAFEAKIAAGSTL